MEKNRRLAYSTESPYTTAEWPVLGGDDETDIVDLLCRLLEPVGNYRREHINPSKGKSSRKRKRHLIQGGGTIAASRTAPPPPDTFSHLTLGFNSTMRYLESLSALSRPQLLHDVMLHQPEGPAAKSVEAAAPLAAVFVCRPGLPPVLTSSLPVLAATASLALPEEPSIRLVPLGKIAGDKVAQSLHQPRVGLVGLRSDTSTGESLIDLVRTRVQPVEVPWLKEVSSGMYLPVKIKQNEVLVGPKKDKTVHSRRDDEGVK